MKGGTQRIAVHTSRTFKLLIKLAGIVGQRWELGRDPFATLSRPRLLTEEQSSKHGEETTLRSSTMEYSEAIEY